ncbi:MAG: LacI family transcriptional regulator [Aestuariivirga sp.]
MVENSDKRPTLRSLAQITGLGVSTVSQALRDSPEIAIETRKRVRLAAQQAGYRPNRAGVRLRTGKSNVITVILNPQDGGSGFFSNMIYGISDALPGTSYHLVVTPYSLSDPMAPVRYVVETNSADGVIISRTQPDDPRVRYLVENSMPFATHGRTDMGITHAYVDYDNEAYANRAVNLLHNKGRKRAALIGPPPVLTYYHHTLDGFERGLAETGMSGFVVNSANSDSSLSDLRAAGLQLATRRDAPDAIVCTSSSIALALIAGLKDGGKEIGVDYDLVAKPVGEMVGLAQPKIIAVGEDFRQTGKDLAQMLMARIDGVSPDKLQKLHAPFENN